MSLANRLWENNYEIALSSLNSRFVQGIKNGNLPKKNFQNYIAQDYFFLESFARAYGLAISKCSDILLIKVLSELLLGISEELVLHETYAKNWGINLDNNNIKNETKQYTDFLYVTSSNYGCIEILAAMTPCMRLYSWIGRKLIKFTERNPYREWIKTYSDDEFQLLTKSLENSLDSFNQFDENLLNNLYKEAMRLEAVFFNAHSDFE
tara:strand:+ start:1466 stop:2089 length:624 start_codon:yes stop_codon:yes gene_type:complete